MPLFADLTPDDIPIWGWTVSYAVALLCLAISIALTAIPQRIPNWLAPLNRLLLAGVLVVIVADVCHDHDLPQSAHGTPWQRVLWVAVCGVLLVWLSGQEQWLFQRSWWRRWGRGAAGIALSGAIFGGTIWRLATARNVEMVGHALPDLATVVRVPVEIPDAIGLTDLGRILPLYAFTPLKREEREQSQDVPTAIVRKVIVMDTSESPANCHGWAFTNGRYLIRSELVDSILHDNGYQVIQDPQPDDLIIYRDLAGVPVHTGIVKAVGNDDFVLIESKWGGMDVFLHRPLDQVYSNSFAYYRSPRPGHLLHIESLSPEQENSGGDPRRTDIPISAE